MEYCPTHGRRSDVEAKDLLYGDYWRGWVDKEISEYAKM